MKSFSWRAKTCVVFILCLSNYLFAQRVIERSAAQKPSWISELPHGKYFNYYSDVGSSPNSLDGAKEQAIANVLSEIIMEGKITVDSRIHTFHEQSNKGIINQVSREILQTGEATLIEGLRKEEEYWQTTKSKTGVLYHYWILMKIQKPEFVGFDLSVKQGYGFTPVWRSVLIPGWGQFHKGEYKKGWKLLASETVLVSSSLVSYYLSNHYNRKAENERDAENRIFYNDWSNRSYTVGTISGIFAGVIHLYNIFDSITAKGVKRYAHKQNEPMGFYASTNGIQFNLNIAINL